MPIISSFSNQFKPIGGNLVVINDLILPPSNDFTYSLIPNNDLTFTLIPTNDLNYIEIPNNDILYGFIPDNDINYVTIPNNDVAYTLIPNTDLTYTLIPNNDIEYSVLKPPTVFYGEIKLGEDSVEGTCNCSVGECPRFYVTGDGPTFCESNIFVTNGDGFNLNGWGTIVHNGFYKTVNMDGTNVATYRTDCGTCPTTPTPTPTPTSTPTPTPTPTPTETPVTSSPYSYTIQARAIDGSNNKYGWVIQQDACQGGEFNVTIYSNSSTFVDGMNFYSDTNVSSINDIVTYMEYYYYYPLENKTFRLLNGNIVGEVVSCPTPTPTPTATETPTPTPTPTATPEMATLTIIVAPGTPSIIFDGDTYTSNVTAGVVKNQQYSINSSDGTSNFWYWSGTGINLPAANSQNTIVFVTGNTATLEVNYLNQPTPTPTSTPTPTPTPTATSTPTPTPTPTPTIQPVSNSYFYYDPGNASSYVSGTTLFDLSGNNRNATISNNPTYTSGTGGYFTFDGVNDYITSPNVYNAGNTAHTLEIWIRPTAVDDCLWSDTGTQIPNADYHYAGGQILQTGPFQQIISGLWATTAVSRTVNGAGTFTNTWIQVVKTYSGTTLTGYINGTAGSPSTITWFPPWNQSANSWYIHFGALDTTTYNSSIAGYFAGRYGIIRFYNRALTPTEVAQNFNADKSKYGL